MCVSEREREIRWGIRDIVCALERGGKGERDAKGRHTRGEREGGRGEIYKYGYIERERERE